jgi:hypothetical protein
MHQTLRRDFNNILRREIEAFEKQCTAKPTGSQGVPSVSHPLFGESGGTVSMDELWEELLAEAGFTELELGLPADYGHGRWTYAQYAMAHAMTKAGWTRAQTATAIGKSRNAVIGLLYRETPWRTVAVARAGGWSKEDTDAVVSLRDTAKWKWRDIAEAVGWSECYCRLRYRETKNPKPEEPHCARV